MANKNKGYARIYRSIQDHWLWESDEPFDRRSAWIDILLMVNQKENEILINGQKRIIKAGQRWTSYKKLADRWHWSYRRVLRYIDLLKSDGMIYVDCTPNGTLLTVANWAFYANWRKTTDTTDDTPDDISPVTPDGTPDGTQTIMSNHENHEGIMRNKKALPPLDYEPEEWQ